MARLSVEEKLTKIREDRMRLDADEKALLSKINREHIETVVALIKKHNLSLDDIKDGLGLIKPVQKSDVKRTKKPAAPVKDKRAVVSPKYKNPEDQLQLWSGRGRPPLWAKALNDADLLHTALITAE